MSGAGYGDFAPHKKMHDDFLAKLKTLSLPLGDGDVNFAKNW